MFVCSCSVHWTLAVCTIGTSRDTFSTDWIESLSMLTSSSESVAGSGLVTSSGTRWSATVSDVTVQLRSSLRRRNSFLRWVDSLNCRYMVSTFWIEFYTIYINVTSIYNTPHAKLQLSKIQFHGSKLLWVHGQNSCGLTKMTTDGGYNGEICVYT